MNKIIENINSKAEFPIHIFPKQIQEIINQTHECSNYPNDFIASSVFFASASAIGNTYCVEVMKKWRETPILFLAIVGNPGTNKTHPCKFSMEPILDRDTQANAEYKKAILKYDSIIALSKNEREEQGINDTPIEPKLTKYIVSDITPESLASILDDNPRGITLYADELATWFNNFNRYSKGSEEQFWLSAYSASHIQINRKSMRGSISIKRPYISVFGTIQPALLRDLAEGSRSKNGFIDRILFVYPLELKKEYWSENILPDHITDSWCSIVEGLLDLPQDIDEYGTAIPKVIEYSKEAWNKLFEWHKYNTDLANTEENEAIKGICSKFDIYVSRFSLVMQLLRWRCGEASKDQIDINSVEASVQIVEYFRKTALRVQQTLNSTEVFKDIPTESKKLYNALPSSFSTGEGTKIAEAFGIGRDSFNRFIKSYKGIFFENIRHGWYQKKI